MGWFRSLLRKKAPEEPCGPPPEQVDRIKVHLQVSFAVEPAGGGISFTPEVQLLYTDQTKDGRTSTWRDCSMGQTFVAVVGDTINLSFDTPAFDYELDVLRDLYEARVRALLEGKLK